MYISGSFQKKFRVYCERKTIRDYYLQLIILYVSPLGLQQEILSWQCGGIVVFLNGDAVVKVEFDAVTSSVTAKPAIDSVDVSF